MTIAHVLSHKGRGVTTILPDATIASAIELMAKKQIGAVVVCDRFDRLVGILSERDVVQGLQERGAAVLTATVRELMTAKVMTCRPSDSIKEVMTLMTRRRIRHVPVLDGNRLVGIVSIGDVVKSRLDEREHEVSVLQEITRLRA